MSAFPTFTQADFIAATGVSPDTAARFEAWRQLLVKWNKRVNLVGHTTLADFWRRHALDSAQLIAVARQKRGEALADATWLDLGSGAGFPGLAVALMLADNTRPVTLVESNSKKASFLREAARVAGVAVTVKAERAEALAPAQADILAARAFAPLSDLLSHMHRLAKPGGLGLFLKGRDAQREVETARQSWEFTLDTTPSVASPDGVVLCVQSLGASQ